MPTRDASSPGLVTTTSASNNIDSGTTAAFSPPANSWIYVSMGGNNVGSSETFNSPTNTGTALTWTKLGSTNIGPGGGGSAVVWRAYNASAQTSITVTCTISGTANSFTGNSTQMVVDVWTGCASSQTGAAVVTGSSSTQNISPTLTTTANGSRVAGCFSDWNGVSTPTSTDTINAGQVAGEASGGRVYKSADTSTSGTSVAVNANAGAAGPSWTYVLYEILSGSSTQSYSYTASGGLTFGGSSSRLMVRTKSGSGGLTFGGTSARSNVRAEPSPSGGITFGGTSAFAKGKTVFPSGGLVFAGSGSPLRLRLAISSGGIVFGGSAPESSSGTQTLTVTPSGGFLIAGVAAVLRKRVYSALGGMTFGGSGSAFGISAGTTAAIQYVRRFLHHLGRRR